MKSVRLLVGNSRRAISKLSKLAGINVNSQISQSIWAPITVQVTFVKNAIVDSVWETDDGL